MSGRFNVRSDFSVISMLHSVFGLRLGGMGAVVYFLNLICPPASQTRSEPWFYVGSRKRLGLLFSIPFSPLRDFRTWELSCSCRSFAVVPLEDSWIYTNQDK